MPLFLESPSPLFQRHRRSCPLAGLIFVRLWMHFYTVYSTCQEKCIECENKFLRLSSGILRFPGKPGFNEGKKKGSALESYRISRVCRIACHGSCPPALTQAVLCSNRIQDRTLRRSPLVQQRRGAPKKPPFFVFLAGFGREPATFGECRPHN